MQGCRGAGVQGRELLNNFSSSPSCPSSPSSPQLWMLFAANACKILINQGGHLTHLT
ncbi:hypothetical protein JYQ62_05400 [Nostoc sp. UHCC 0702]|nr:hypothetical protein JYQ62_05400 [Nostoc sp. UHCC 0702]